MTDKKSNDSRRKLLKSIAAGSGAVVAGKSLPESWTKPLVDTVILPVHAEMTDDSGSEAEEITRVEYFGRDLEMVNFVRTSVANEIQKTDLFAGIVDTLVPSAHAGGTIRVRMLDGMSIVVEGSSATIQFMGRGEPRLFSVVVSTSGAPSGKPTFVAGCKPEEGDGPVSAQMIGYVNDAPNARVRVTSSGQDGYASWEVVVPKRAIEKLTAECVPSDARLKTNIERLSVSRNGLSLYRFQYLADANKNTYVGVMAQDVMARHPEAIVRNEDGYYMVRYNQLGLKMVTLEEWETKGAGSVELVH